jgi:hypothetical protein
MSTLSIVWQMPERPIEWDYGPGTGFQTRRSLWRYLQRKDFVASQSRQGTRVPVVSCTSLAKPVCLQPIKFAKEGLENLGEVDQSILSDFFCPVDDITMSRIVRHILFASVLACHAAVTLCGPCLHALSGSSHDQGAASKSHRPDDPTPSRRDAADNCLICQFVAQGQLPVEFSHGLSTELIAELVAPALPAAHALPRQLPSSPRAPPSVTTSLS